MKAKLTKGEEAKQAKTNLRGTLGRRNYSVIEDDPNYERRWVITDADFGKKYADEYERVEDFIDKGWDVVYSEERPADERANAPDNDKKNSERLKPVTKRLRGGRTAILMKCHKDIRAENEATKAQVDKERLLASIKSMKKKGNEEIYTDHDVDLSKK